MLWRAVSYGLPRSFKPKNISNGHQMSENDIINRWGQVYGSGESASVSSFRPRVINYFRFTPLEFTLEYIFDIINNSIYPSI